MDLARPLSKELKVTYDRASDPNVGYCLDSISVPCLTAI